MSILSLSMRCWLWTGINIGACLLLASCGGASSDSGRDAAVWDGREDRDAAVADAAVTDSDQVTDAWTDGTHDAGEPERSTPVLGVTITDPWALQGASGPRVLERLDRIAGDFGLPTVRVVFDESMDQTKGGGSAVEYAPILAGLSGHARIMGELLDSFYVSDYSLQELTSRACEYRAGLAHLVDIWEVGNEVNGEWLGDSLAEKLLAVFRVFTSTGQDFALRCPGWTLRSDERPFQLAVTLYYNGPYDGGQSTDENCWEDPDHAMLHWTETTFGQAGALAAMVPHLDYVWISYYEDDCNGIQPDWPSVYGSLVLLFPNSLVGFGECGTTNSSRKVRMAMRYYHGMDSPDPDFANMHILQPRYVGGLFWWYFSRDLDDDPFFSVLTDALSRPFWSAP